MEIIELGITSVAGITVLCYLVALAIKQTPLANKWLPSICGAVGCALGIVAMLAMPTFPATDIITAMAIGTVSGLAATGANEALKQLHTSAET